MSKVLVIDPVKCKGCHSCEITCATWNEGECNINLSRIRVVSYLKEVFFVPMVCLQCEEAFCALVCPVNALHRDAEKGIVKLNKDKCIGCKLCLVACPFGNMSFARNTSSKCELCDGDPMCVKSCQWKALTYEEPDQTGWSKKVLVANKIFEVQQHTPSESKK